jgi:hypothetical protein
MQSNGKQSEVIVVDNASDDDSVVIAQQHPTVQSRPMPAPTNVSESPQEMP